MSIRLLLLFRFVSTCVCVWCFFIGVCRRHCRRIDAGFVRSYVCSLSIYLTIKHKFRWQASSSLVFTVHSEAYTTSLLALFIHSLIHFNQDKHSSRRLRGVFRYFVVICIRCTHSDIHKHRRTRSLTHSFQHTFVICSIDIIFFFIFSCCWCFFSSLGSFVCSVVRTESVLQWNMVFINVTHMCLD